MTTIPQLRNDIAKLQDELRAVKAELEAERAKPPVERVVVRDVPKLVTKTLEIPVPGPERVVYRDGPERVVYRDNPEHLKMIRKLQGRK